MSTEVWNRNIYWQLMVNSLLITKQIGPLTVVMGVIAVSYFEKNKFWSNASVLYTCLLVVHSL